jgi:predicted dehydrogenase
LKQLAVTVSGSLLLAELPWWSPLRAAPPGNSPADRVRLGIIGVGSRGRALLAHLLRTPGVEIAALCDDYEPHRQRGLALAGNQPRAFADYHRMLEMPGLDGVIISTPLHLHAPICLAALAADKPVFCEKSLAYSIAECQAIARAAGASRRVFQVGHQRLYSAAFLQAYERVRAGEIGDIKQIRAYWHRNGDWRNPVPSPALERRLNWRLYREYSHGLMTELASHHVQVANWFLGTHPLSCVGYGSINFWKDGREVYDNVNVVYRYPGGVQMIYDSLISNGFYGLEIQIMGPRGTIEGETGKLFSENPPPAPGIVQLINGLEHGVFETIPLGGPSWVPDLKKDTRGRPLGHNLNGDDGTAVELAAFANAIRLGEKIPRMIEHACHAGVAVIMGQTAMDQGGEVTWPKDFVI